MVLDDHPADSSASSTSSDSAGTNAGNPSRRRFLAAGAVASITALVGCTGNEGTTETDGPTTTAGDETTTAEDTASGDLETPWTTQELKRKIDPDASITIYGGTGDSQQWYDLVDVVNDEFGTSLQPDVFASDGGKVSQRFLQERQAENDQADVVSNASDIRDEIKIDGEDVARQYYEWDVDENFWFKDVLPDESVLPFMTAAFNGGAGSVLPINRDIFEEQGLDVPDSYNDLFDDQYADLDVILPGYIVASEVGWIIGYHAEQAERDPLDWITELRDHLNFVGASSHTAGARNVAEGDAPMMFYNFPWVVSPFIADSPLVGHFTDPVKSSAIGGPLAINKNAPNPWTARFFVSAVLEEQVQRRMINDVTDQTPVRLDLDYSPQNPDPFTSKRLNANLFTIGFYESAEYSRVGQRAKDEGGFEI